MGHDIIADAVTKTSKAIIQETKKKLVVYITNFPDELYAEIEEVLSQFGDQNFIAIQLFRDAMSHVTELMGLKMSVWARRAEPYGLEGLQTMSTGYITLISDKSQLASVIGGLTEDSHIFIGEVFYLFICSLKSKEQNYTIRIYKDVPIQQDLEGREHLLGPI